MLFMDFDQTFNRFRLIAIIVKCREVLVGERGGEGEGVGKKGELALNKLFSFISIILKWIQMDVQIIKVI